MSGAVIDTVKCEAWGCGVRIRRDAGSVFCVKHEAEYEQVGYTLEARRLAKLLEARTVPGSPTTSGPGGSVPVEILTAPVAADPARRSALLEKLPRLHAGVRELAEPHAGDACEASDFGIPWCDGWRDQALAAGLVCAGVGLTGAALFLLGLGAKVALGWVLGRSA